MIQTQTIFVILFYGTLVTAVWNAPSEKNPSHTCGLRRLHIDDLLAKESTTFHHSLLERLHTIDTPVVIEGALSSWSALEKWSNQSYFLDTFGHLLLPRNSVTNTSLDVAQDGPSADNTTAENYTIGEFVHSLRASTDTPDGKSPYHLPLLLEMEKKQECEGEVNSVSLLSQLAGDLDSALFQDWGKCVISSSENSNTNSEADDGVSMSDSDLRVFSMSGERGGLPPHKHAASWLGLILGHKHWTFLPPPALSPAAFSASGVKGKGSSFDLYVQAALNSPSLWSEELRSLLQGEVSDVGETVGGNVLGGQGMLECTQLPSEVIYVPPNWWHSTLNGGDTIGIGAQAEHLFSHSFSNTPRTQIDQKTFTSEKGQDTHHTSDNTLDHDCDRDGTCHMPAGCANTLAELCTSLQHFPPASLEGIAARNIIQDITATTFNKDHRERGAAGLITDTENDVDRCNAVAHRQISKKVIDLEPLNIKYILAHAKAFYLYPLEHLSKKNQHGLQYDPVVSSSSNPVLRAAKFIHGKVKKTYQQFQKNNLKVTEAMQLILRMGLFLDELQSLAGEALACPNVPPHLNRTECGTWGMNRASEKKFMSLLNATVEIYNTLEDISLGTAASTAQAAGENRHSDAEGEL